MKKLFLLICTAFLLAVSSCSTYSPKMYHSTFYIDYQEAGKGAVFITEANSVSFEYEPIGSILVEEHPGVVEETVETTKKERNYDPLYGEGASTKKVKKYETASSQSALNYAANEAIRLGGDGIINLRLSSYVDRNGANVVQVSGMVIKRK